MPCKPTPLIDPAPLRRASDTASTSLEDPGRERATLHFGTLRARIAVILTVLFGMLVGTLILLFAAGIIRIDDDAVDGTISRFGLLVVAIAVIEFGVVVALGVALARTITKPLSELLRATRSIAKGRNTKVR